MKTSTKIALLVAAAVAIALPAQAAEITGAGSTFVYPILSKWSADYSAKAGINVNYQSIGSGGGPVGVGGKGNEGVATYVTQTKNSIGYVEYAYVIQNKMTYGLVQNKAGKFITPNAASFQAAAASADWGNAKDFYLVMTDAPGEDAYPIAATTFMIMYKQPKDAARTTTAIDFFKWALEDGQQQANDLDYVPLPPSLVRQIESYWAAEFKS